MLMIRIFLDSRSARRTSEKRRNLLLSDLRTERLHQTRARPGAGDRPGLRSLPFPEGGVVDGSELPSGFVDYSVSEEVHKLPPDVQRGHGGGFRGSLLLQTSDLTSELMTAVMSSAAPHRFLLCFNAVVKLFSRGTQIKLHRLPRFHFQMK